MRTFANKENFTTVLHHQPVGIFFLENEKIRVAVTNYGARIVHILVRDKQGNWVDVVVGYDSFNAFYHSEEAYFGATVGRYCNRIAAGEFFIEGQKYSLACNNGANSLHGGPGGFHGKVWNVKQQDSGHVLFSYLSPDGEEGFPGNVNVKVSYAINDNGELRIDYEASTDRSTVLNLTNHTYFNLNGGGKVADHILKIEADRYTPVDANLIPTGELADVSGTPFDFRKPMAIGEREGEAHPQLILGNGYDHNYVLNGETGQMKMAAEVYSESSGIVLQVHTTEPGMQLYGANFLQTVLPLKDGRVGESRTAFCLETQHFPDSPNQPDFPTTLLKPGEIYASTTIYKFLCSVQ